MVKSDLLVKIGSGHVYQSKEVLGELKPMKQAQPLTNIYVSLPTDVCTGYGDSLEPVSPSSPAGYFPSSEIKCLRKKPCIMQVAWSGGIGGRGRVGEWPGSLTLNSKQPKVPSVFLQNPEGRSWKTESA